jgi:anti-sigma factor RsiW
MKGPVTCKEVREGLTEYLDEALPPVRRQGFVQHLAACPACERCLRQLAATRAAVSCLPREPMPDGMKRKLLEAMRRRESA